MVVQSNLFGGASKVIATSAPGLPEVLVWLPAGLHVSYAAQKKPDGLLVRVPHGAHLLAMRGLQEAQAYANVIARATSHRNAINILFSLSTAALRGPRGGHVACLWLAIYFPALEPVAAKFAHVQISNHSHGYAEKLYHIIRFFWEAHSRAPCGPEVARR